MKSCIWIALALLAVLGAERALGQNFSGSIFDQEWEKTHPQGSDVQSPPPAPAPETKAPANAVSDTALAPPATQSGAAVAAPVRKVSVPDAAAQKEAEKLVDEVFRTDIAAAKTPEQKEALAKNLLEVGEETQKNLAARFVLWRLARDLAAEAGDAETALHCADEIGRGYQVDAPAMKVEVAIKLLRAIQHPADYGSLVGRLDGLIDEALAADRPEVARQIGDLGVSAAYRSEDAGLVKQATARVAEIRELEAAHVEVKKALAVLAAQPGDGGANLVVGKYRCFMRDDWAGGLPMLVRGSDAALKALAEKDLAKPADAQAQVDMANQWWDAAQKEKGIASRHIKLHAAALYKTALPNVTGLSQVLVEKRIKEVEEGADTTVAAAGPRVGSKIDLLRLIDVSRDKVFGTWTLGDQGLDSDNYPASRIRLPYQPPEEYDFHVEFSRISGNQCICLLLSTARTGFMLNVGGWQNSVVGFGNVNGHPENDNVTTVKLGSVVDPNRRYSVTVEVRRDHIAAYIDGKLVTQYKTDYSDLSMVGGFVIDPGFLGLATHQSPTRFYVVEVTEVTGQGRVVTTPAHHI